MSLENIYLNPKDVYYTSYDLSFVTGDSPITLNIKTTLGRRANEGYIHNFGSGALSFSLSANGTDFGNEIYLPIGDRFLFDRMNVSKIRLTWVADTSYEVFAL